MANLSDAFGTIKVKKVGKEFIEYLNEAQEDAEYLLADYEDYRDVKPDENGDLEFTFSTAGRWSYDNNIEGYLEGGWGEQAWPRFVEALKDKHGVVEIEYTDSESSNFWMGQGTASLQFTDGELTFANEFDSQEMNVRGYAELTGMTEHEALEALHGDEALAAYYAYVNECEQDGESPDSIDDWYEEYEG